MVGGGPAERAGLEADDVILEIDGRNTNSMSSAVATELLRGPDGSPVRLRVRKKGGDDRGVQIELVRGVVDW